MRAPLRISDGLRRLLETRLDSFEKLEVVVRLRRTSDGRQRLAELASQLQVGEHVLRRLIVDLQRTATIELAPDDTVCLRLDASDGELISEAAGLYAKSRSDLIALYASVALDRIRSMEARNFADAFRFRKKKEGGGG